MWSEQSCGPLLHLRRPQLLPARRLGTRPARAGSPPHNELHPPPAKAPGDPTASVSPDFYQCLGGHSVTEICHQGPVPGLPGHGPGRDHRLRRPVLPTLEVPPLRREGPKPLAWSEILRFERRLADGSYRQSNHRIKTGPGSEKRSRCAFFALGQHPTSSHRCITTPFPSRPPRSGRVPGSSCLE
jgi:hypothetical protein